jgi:hypothetical protein
MLEVLTSFCARLYGRRSARNRAEKALRCAERDVGPTALSHPDAKVSTPASSRQCVALLAGIEFGPLFLASRAMVRDNPGRRSASQRHFGDATNSDVTVAFGGTSVTVLQTLAHEG